MFDLHSPYQPGGDQPKAIEALVEGLSLGRKHQVLKGATGTGKTFVMANIIASVKKPTLVIAHNKTLAAQLYGEFASFFPESAVHYFVSYFDYYQPEAYIASSDTYIEKDSKINEEIDRLRHAATSSLLEGKDVIIVASVSCIYGIGSVEDYGSMAVKLKAGEVRKRDKLLRHLSDIQYQRNDIDFGRGTFRVRGDVVDVIPASGEEAIRIDFFGDEIESITKLNPLTGEVLARPNEVTIYPSSHYVTPHDKVKLAVKKIEDEYEDRKSFFLENNKLLEEQRLSQRIKFDLEMLKNTGFVKGIENYSRYLTNREEGDQPATLLDYFPDDYLMIIDESHMTMPQIRGMYNGDRARKETLVNYEFRLPSALDNRPLRFDEFARHQNQTIYVSATPAEYELSLSAAELHERHPELDSGSPDKNDVESVHPEEPQLEPFIEQIIRPTGLIDPEVEVKPAKHQIDDAVEQIKLNVAKNERILVTTLTKRMAEDLTDYLEELKLKVAYIHSDVDTVERTDILRDLRLGVYDIVVGINLLREGLDLPEVSLVLVLDADKEGFLRSESALIQTIGRAARHVNGRVIMYGDVVTRSMKAAIDETNYRRERQIKFNQEHGITPEGIKKAIDEGIRAVIGSKKQTKQEKELGLIRRDVKKISKEDKPELIKDLTLQMELASKNLEFERAAELRDVIQELKG